MWLIHWASSSESQTEKGNDRKSQGKGWQNFTVCVCVCVCSSKMTIYKSQSSKYDTAWLALHLIHFLKCLWTTRQYTHTPSPSCVFNFLQRCSHVLQSAIMSGDRHWHVRMSVNTVQRMLNMWSLIGVHSCVFIWNKNKTSFIKQPESAHRASLIFLLSYHSSLFYYCFSFQSSFPSFSSFLLITVFSFVV